MNPCFLGIDTSNYTTSIAIVDAVGNMLFDKRILLSVKPGELGLRQSDAFYQHVMNLPGLFFDVPQDLIEKLEGIAVSVRPRNVEASYMPVFNAGHQFAKVIGKSLGLTPHLCSHQDGHIMAGFTGFESLRGQRFLNLHISGGTTELFTSVWNDDLSLFDTEVMGGTKDLALGQLIDRIGVYGGLPFPAGPNMERLILEKQVHKADPKLKLPLKADGCWFNLSGLENKLKQFLDNGDAPEQVYYELFTQIGDLLYTVLKQAIRGQKPDGINLAGGVMSNHWIRKVLEKLQSEFPEVSVQFVEPALCTDNAVGVARIALINGTGLEKQVDL